MDVRAARLIGLAALAAVAVIATAVGPLPAAASCLPPDMQAFSDTPDVVVVAGHVIDVRDDEVDFDVQLHWGPEPRRVVTIARPEVDPTVVTSTDWNPQPGEPWIVIATREGERLRTETCMQLPGTREAEAQVRSSLGEPVRPSLEADPGAGAGASGDASGPVSPSGTPRASGAGDGAGAARAPDDASRAGAASSPFPVLVLTALVVAAVVAVGLLLRRRSAA